MEVRIVDWKTKCGCTNVRVGSKVIPPGTQTTVEATIDTTRFQGPKASGLTLFLDRPAVTEVDLNMNCFIRADITLAPGLVDFGVVRPSGKAADGRAHPQLRRRPARLGNRRHENPDRQGQGRRQGTGPNRPTGGSSGMSPPRSSRGFPTAISRMRSSLITNDSPPQTIPDLGRGQHPERRLRHPVDHQLRPTQARPVGEQGRARALGVSILRSPGSPAAEPGLQAVEEKTGSASDHTVNITLKAPDSSGPFHAVLKVESDLKDEPPAQIKTFATIVASP